MEKVLQRDGVEYRIPYIARKAIEYLETNALVKIFLNRQWVKWSRFIIEGGERYLSS